MTIALVNGRVLTDNGFQGGFAVLVDGGTITGLALPSDPRVRAAERHDLGGRALLPGFIDCQVNGGGGVLFNDAPTVDTIRRASAGTSGAMAAMRPSSMIRARPVSKPSSSSSRALISAVAITPSP